MELPFSPACERNKDAILEALNQLLSLPCTVLEIGSGTGQHAVHFASVLSNLSWLPSEQAEHLPDLNRRLHQAQLTNIRPAIELNVNQSPWPSDEFDAVFSSNTLHVVSESTMSALFAGAAQVLVNDGLMIVYGPFNYAGKFTSDGNQRLDLWAKDTFGDVGLKDQEDVVNQAAKLGLKLRQDRPMPANNRMLVFDKQVKCDKR